MEINPHLGVPYLPIYHTAGYNPFFVQEGLKKGLIPTKTETEGFAVVRCNYSFDKGDRLIEHKKKHCFLIFGADYSHTYAFSYSKQSDLTSLVEKEFSSLNLDV